MLQITQQQEKDILEEKSSRKTYKQLAEQFNLTESQVRYVFTKNNIKKNSKYSSRTFSSFTEEEFTFIKDNINNYSTTYFEKKFNTTAKVLYHIYKHLNLVKKHTVTFKRETDWTENQEKLLIDNYKDLSIQELSKLIGKTERAIARKKWSLSLYVDKAWSIKEDEFLKRYSDEPIDFLVLLLSRSKKSINHRFNTLNIKKSKVTQTSIESLVEDRLKELNVDYIFNKILPNSEFNFRPDFRIESIKTIIEVHGDYWHGNPELYSADDLNKHLKQKIKVDSVKKDYYESLGYTVIIIWENDLKNKYEETISFLDELFVKKPSIIEM